MDGRTDQLVFVSVGTDVHPFNRLVSWMDEWLLSRTTDRLTCIVQGGTSHASRLGEWHELLPYPEVIAHLQRADAVVCHGGPATIMDCRDAGALPIVVPRRPELGEHVDDHQVRFAHRLAELGLVTLASTYDELAMQLDAALDLPEGRRLDTTPASVEIAIDRFGRLVDQLLRSPRRRLARR